LIISILSRRDVVTIETISIMLGVFLLVLLKLLLKDEKGPKQDDGIHDDAFKEEPEFDRTWSSLPGNVFNRSNDD
jgi:hypothetical protein